MMNFQCFSTTILVVITILFSTISDLVQEVEAAQYIKQSSVCTNKTREKAESYMQKLVSVGEGGRRFPENKVQLKQYCDDSTKMINYLNDYVDQCLMADVRELSKIMIFSAKNAVKQFCKRKLSKKLNALLSVTPCINEHLMEGQCYRRFLAKVGELQFIDNDRLKMPHACCQYVALMGCIETLVGSVPCSRKNLSTIMDFLGSIFGNTASVACGEYNDSSDKCERMGPPPPIPSNLTSHKQYSTFFFALIDLMASIK